MSVRLNLEYDREFFENDEKEWKTFVWHRNKCGYTKLSDSAAECNSQLQEGAVVSYRTTVESFMVQQGRRGTLPVRSRGPLSPHIPNTLLRNREKVPSTPANRVLLLTPIHQLNIPHISLY